ncbi:serine/threonine-protein kinase S6KL isoform X2 [Culex pipiens pallens]|uniref:serine/threonine-protein kinase S6KL isoform X2 n=1 Tax=Culex pipiens pallens TaxID=42434 RepID=UPI0022AA9281|nr:serine/threonine-protein kinase S6KL isoform X2 [Culex pipiens pallens]
MGNANSSAIFLQSEAKPACAIPEQSLSPVQQFPEFAASSKKESSGSRASSRQIRRSASIDEDGGVFNRLSESFQRISRSLSCTALDTTGHSQRQRHRNLRPWSRVSRRRWHESTLANEHLLSKTCWPVTKAESLFLPHFPVDSIAESQYAVVEHIANGAFGKVYKVRAGERTTAADYALKVLSKSEIINSGAIGQLRDEVDIQTICGHHPFLARCVRFWQNKKKVFLHFLHQAGIIHRDLKPENVLLDEDFHVRLIDFGFARWLSIGTRTRTICGTLQYMAPEILAGEPYGHAIDWWALGVLACRMYTGEYPSLDYSAYLNKSDQIDKLIEHGRPRKLSTSKKLLPSSVDGLPPEGQDLLKRLLEIKPQYRIRSLLQLQRIGLYKNYDWDLVRKKQILPRNMINVESASGTIEQGSLADKSFAEFDW